MILFVFGDRYRPLAVVLIWKYNLEIQGVPVPTNRHSFHFAKLQKSRAVQKNHSFLMSR
mgnify:CR=1 FL=1